MLKKIKKYGIIRGMWRLIGNSIYQIVRACYKIYLDHFTEVDTHQILFLSTPSFADNSKVMYEYLLKNNDKNHHFVWLMHREDDCPATKWKKTEFVKCDSYAYKGFSLKALKKISTSKYIFFTHTSPVKHIKKRKNQIIVNLWHGCGYKDIQDSKLPWIQKNPFDIAIVPGTIFKKTKSSFWGCPKNIILPIGYPRYDLLYAKNEKGKRFIQHLKSNSNKLVLWMPTFRNTGNDEYPEEHIPYDFELPLFKSNEDISMLNKYCRDKKITICLKRHPKQISYVCESHKYSNIKFISNEDFKNAEIEMYSVLQYTDALISDYSSIAIDYLLLKKPLAFSLDDFEEYKNSRGFVFDDPLHYMPGHHLYNLEDLCAFIDDVSNGIDRFAREREKIMPEVHNPCDNYCERVWTEVEKFASTKCH